MSGAATKTRVAAALAALAAVAPAACSNETKTTTVTTEQREGTAKLKAFAFSETRLQARRTCVVVPREVLAMGFARRSSGVVRGAPRRYDDNAVALLYVEDIDINPIRLQTAAYNGCLRGLQDQRRRTTRTIEPLDAAIAGRVRRHVIEGARRDFRQATGDPAGFARCFVPRLGRKLTRARLGRFVALHASHGEPTVARALNGLGAPIGDECGGRRYVPQLTGAATGLDDER